MPSPPTPEDAVRAAIGAMPVAASINDAASHIITVLRSHGYELRRASADCLLSDGDAVQVRPGAHHICAGEFGVVDAVMPVVPSRHRVRVRFDTSTHYFAADELLRASYPAYAAGLPCDTEVAL